MLIIELGIILGAITLEILSISLGEATYIRVFTGAPIPIKIVHVVLSKTYMVLPFIWILSRDTFEIVCGSLLLSITIVSILLLLYKKRNKLIRDILLGLNILIMSLVSYYKIFI